MKKTLKGLSAILMTSVLAVSASAATVGSLTASAASIAVNSTDGGSYTAYPILTGSVNGSSLGNVNYATGFSLTSALLTELKGDSTFGSGTSNAFNDLSTSSPASAFAADIAKLSTTAQQERFAKIIGKYTTTGGLTVGTDTSDIAEGYYVIKGTNSKGTSLNLLNVVGTVEISGKGDSPSSAKTVDDKNDSTGAAETGKDTADYDIGDTIPYTLTFTLPSDYASYEKYPITFVDDMCAGLSYNGDAKIWYGTVTGEGEDITFSHDTEATSATTSGKVYKATISDLKVTKPALTADTVITIKYTATLNANAVIGNDGTATAGNPNTYNVIFANDPNWYDDGEGGTQPDTPPTGETPKKTNTVFTYKLVVNKIKSDNTALTGADFDLYKFVEGTGSDTYKVGETTYSGKWTLVTALNTGEGAVNPSKSAVAADTTSFTFSGIDDGVYKLVESTTPKGYNTIEPIIFTIAPTSDGYLPNTIKLGSEAFSCTDSSGAISGNVVNNAGVTLPGTGGMGTTIFYIVGGLMISGALVLLIVRKRMSIKEK